MVPKIVAAFLATAIAFPAHAGFVEARTKHFVIYGDMSEEKAARFAHSVEQIDQMLRQFTNAPKSEPTRTDVVDVYVVPGLSQIQAMVNSRNVAGFYSGTAQDTHAVVPLSMPPEYGMNPNEILIHEYTHHILLNTSNTHYPSWLQEGMAEFFGTARVDNDGNIQLGAPPQSRGYNLANNYQLSVAEMLDSDRTRLEQDAVADKYAKGWLLVHYLMLSGKRNGQLDTYLRELRQGKSSLAAAKIAFGDLGKLDSELKAYNRGKFTVYKIPGDQFPIGPVSTRKMDDCEDAIMPLRMRSAAGVNEKTAVALIAPARAISAKCPNSPFVQRALAEMEFDAKNNAESLAAADRALAADPKNIMSTIYRGRVFARQKKFADARSQFVKANRADPNYALPMVLYYDSFMLEGVKPPKAAMDGLLRSAVLVPQDPSVRFRVAYAWIRDGQLKDARDLLVPYRDSAESNPKSPVVAIIKKIDEGADAKTVLAEADKAKWNELGKE